MSRELAFTPRPVTRGALLSPEGAAKLFPADLGIDANWVRRRISPRVKIGRKVLFYEQDVLDWIASHRASA